MQDNPYLALTREFNEGRLRALLSSGQAVVVHRLAVMSKDGDWVLREDDEAAAHVLRVLERHGARYRFGAPLDARWLAGGWSSHFEYRADGLRIRTDFVSRPPRVSPELRLRMWREAESSGNDVVGLEPLAAMKLTNREKDYAVVGELPRPIDDPRRAFRFSRSGRDLIRLAEHHADLVAELSVERPLLACIAAGLDALEEALDRERRTLMRANEERLARYRRAASAWSARWPDVASAVDGLPLGEAHRLVVARAEGVLPFAPPEGAAP